MALTDESSGNGFYMPVAPAYGGGYGNGNGFFGGDWAWILLLLLIGGGGWGFGGGFGGGAMWPMMMGGCGMDYLYPWLNNSEHISDGFRDAQLHDTVTSIGDKITNGFTGVNSAITNASVSNMQQLFGVQSALQNCCCENRAGLADLKYTVATENCADRAALSDGLRDVLAATQAQTQTVLDKLCALELDGYKREADNLRTQLNMATLRESQTAQTAQILAGQAAEIDGVYNRLKNCPVPTMPVYGNTPIFTCAANVANGGCGCNSGIGF